MPVKGLYSQILWEDETQSQQEENAIPNLVHDGLISFLFLAMLCLCGCAGFSVAATSRAQPLAIMHRLLIEAASLVAERGP